MTGPLIQPPHLDEDSRSLVRIARGSIRHGLARGTPLPVALEGASPRLADLGACFVSLHRDGDLRGCIGALEATLPLAQQTSESAFSAAFRDPRFPPLGADELAGLAVEIHVMSPLAPLPFAGAESLYAQLRTGIDGLVLQQGFRRAVFLPVMWEQLPDPVAFVAHLMQKAGIAGWDGLRAERFTVDAIRDAP